MKVRKQRTKIIIIEIVTSWEWVWRRNYKEFNLKVQLFIYSNDFFQMCNLLKSGDWTVERDEDLTAPYAFSKTTWLAFEDEVSVNIKV